MPIYVNGLRERIIIIINRKNGKTSKLARRRENSINRFPVTEPGHFDFVFSRTTSIRRPGWLTSLVVRGLQTGFRRSARPRRKRRVIY